MFECVQKCLGGTNETSKYESIMREVFRNRSKHSENALLALANKSPAAEYLIDTVKFIQSYRDLRKANESYSLRTVIATANPRMLRFVIEKVKWVTSLEDFKSILNSPRSFLVTLLVNGNVRVLENLMKAHPNEFESLETFEAFMRSRTGTLSAQNRNSVKEYFDIKDDIPGGSVLIEDEMDRILKEEGISNGADAVTKFSAVLARIEKSLFSRMDRSEESKYSRPKDNPHTKQNAFKCNELQNARLQRFSKTDVNGRVREVRNMSERNLVLYVRKNRGDMDSLRFCAIAHMLYQYVVVEKRSPVFTNVLIVSREKDVYPKQVHEIGIPTSVYKPVVGRLFEELGLGGNMMFFTHSYAADQQDMYSVPILGQSVLQNVTKYNPDMPFVPLNSFYDIHDNSAKYGMPISNHNYKEFESKDKGQSVKGACAWALKSVLDLENMMLADLKVSKLVKVG